MWGWAGVGFVTDPARRRGPPAEGEGAPARCLTRNWVGAPSAPSGGSGLAGRTSSSGPSGPPARTPAGSCSRLAPSCSVRYGSHVARLARSTLGGEGRGRQRGARCRGGFRAASCRLTLCVANTAKNEQGNGQKGGCNNPAYTPPNYFKRGLNVHRSRVCAGHGPHRLVPHH